MADPERVLVAVAERGEDVVVAMGVREGGGEHVPVAERVAVSVVVAVMLGLGEEVGSAVPVRELDKVLVLDLVPVEEAVGVRLWVGMAELDREGVLGGELDLVDVDVGVVEDEDVTEVVCDEEGELETLAVSEDDAVMVLVAVRDREGVSDAETVLLGVMEGVRVLEDVEEAVGGGVNDGVAELEEPRERDAVSEDVDDRVWLLVIEEVGEAVREEVDVRERVPEAVAVLDHVPAP